VVPGRGPRREGKMDDCSPDGHSPTPSNLRKGREVASGNRPFQVVQADAGVFHNSSSSMPTRPMFSIVERTINGQGKDNRLFFISRSTEFEKILFWRHGALPKKTMFEVGRGNRFGTTTQSKITLKNQGPTEALSCDFRDWRMAAHPVEGKHADGDAEGAGHGLRRSNPGASNSAPGPCLSGQYQKKDAVDPEYKAISRKFWGGQGEGSTILRRLDSRAGMPRSAGHVAQKSGDCGT